MKKGIKILLVSDFHVNVFCWRKEILDEILALGGDVALAVPYGEKLEYFKEQGCHLFDVKMDRHGLGLLENLKLLFRYRKILKNYKPDVVLLYGSKGMLYAGFFCRLYGIKYLPNINGVGTIDSMALPLRKFMYFLYRLVVPHAETVFFQNNNNKNEFKKKGICGKRNVLLPGSGVNLMGYPLMDYPNNDRTHFLFCARVMREKGIYEFVEAARILSKQGIDCVFDVIGMSDDSESEQIMSNNKDLINYYGFQSDIHSFLERTNCVVLPSFYGEGISNSLLESAASGKPIITTNMPGCRETVDDSISGYIVEPKNAEDLAEKMLTFCNLTQEQKRKMGILARHHVEKNFDRKIVVNAYIHEIERIT